MPPKEMLGPFRVLRPVPPEAGLGPELSVAQWEGDDDRAGELVFLRRFEAKGLARARVIRELGQAKELRHRALAKVYGWYEDDGALVAVLEHVEGMRLDQIVHVLIERDERLSDYAIAELFLQLSEAIAHAQEAKDDRGRGLKLVHGTLGPDRVVLTRDGDVKVYGTALRALFGAEGRAKWMRAYTAPELRGGSHGTSRGDVFALGMMMWTLFTGRIPEPHGSPPEKIGRFREGLDEALGHAIDTAVDRVALKRRVTCRAVAQLLQSMVSTNALGEELKRFTELGLELEQPHAEAEVDDDDDEEDKDTLVPVESLPPDEESKDDKPTAGAPNEDSTIERLSDLLDTLEVGSEEPARDSTDEGWLVDVVRKSSPQFLTEAQAQPPKNEPANKQPKEKPAKDGPATRPKANERKEGTPPPLPAEAPELPPPLPVPPELAPEPKKPTPTSSKTPGPTSEPTPSPPPEPKPGPSPAPEPAAAPKRAPAPEPGRAPAPSPQAPEPTQAPEPAPASPPDMIVPGTYQAPPAEPVRKKRPWLMAAVGAGIGLGAAYFATAGPSETEPPTTTAEVAPPTKPAPPPPASAADPEPTGEPSAPPSSEPSSEPSAQPSSEPSSEPSAQPSSEPSSEPSAQPAASDLPSIEDEHGGDGSELLSNQAYLIVRSPIAAEVVVQGVSRGMTNAKLISSCYTRNVRLRDPETKAWLSDGQAVIIPCMQTTMVTIDP